jgi:hypothetical protein
MYRIADFEMGGTLNLEKEKENVDDNAGCYALTKLAQFFGYSGYQKESELKEFFDEDHADMFGIYWDEDTWYLNKSWGFDEELGENLTAQTVDKAAALMEVQHASTMEHKGEAIVLNLGYKYIPQVHKMAGIIRKALREYAETHPEEKHWEAIGYERKKAPKKQYEKIETLGPIAKR